TFLGGSAGNFTTTGISNVGMGTGALQGLTNGNNNTALGYSALGGVTTGTNNIAIGYTSGLNIVTGSNNIYIGNTGTPANTDQSTIRIGTPGTHTQTYLSGNVTLGTAGSGLIFPDATKQTTALPSSCTSNQVPTWNGTAWACSTPSSGSGTVTSI